MAKTLQEILIDSSSILDLSSSLPTGDDLNTRINYADQAVWDATAVAQLPEFKAEYQAVLTSAVTVPLPVDFREPQENPQLYAGGAWTEYEIIKPEHKYEKSDGERYCYILGNPSDGYNLIFNALVENSTLSLVYQKFPNGFATLSDKCELSDPQYVTRKVESYVLYSRSDDRFTIAEQRANVALSNMMARGQKMGVPANSTKSSFNNPLRNLA